VRGDCGDRKCPGWAVFNGNDVQRCDACDMFANDDRALEEAGRVLILNLERRLNMAGERDIVTLSGDDAIVALQITEAFLKSRPKPKPKRKRRK
jgi:hypothetical protein